MQYRWVLLLMMFALVAPVIANPAAIMFDFDDNRESIYTDAYPLLVAHGFNATWYIIEDNVGLADNVTEPQLTNVYNAGWDVGDHTKSHGDLSVLSLAEQEVEIGHCRDYLDSLGFSRSSHHLSFPGSKSNADTVTAMTSLDIKTGRGVVGGDYPILYPNSDVYHIPIRGELFSTTSSAAVLSEISSTSSDYVLIYLSHGIGDGGYGAPSLATFHDIVDYVSAQGIPVVTISQFYEMNANRLEWISGYNYRQCHYINGTDSGSQTNYQIQLNISNTVGSSSGNLMYLQGHALNFPNDLYFTNATNNRWDYWVESNNATYATVWVEVPSIPSGSTSQVEMYCYYGNSTIASESNGTNTFPLLFDHFGDASINTSLWTATGSVSTSSSNVTIAGGGTSGQLISISDFGTNTTMRWFGSQTFNHDVATGETDAGYADGWNAQLFFVGGYPTNFVLNTYTWDGASEAGANIGTGFTGTHIREIQRINSTSHTWRIDNGVVTAPASPYSTNNMHALFRTTTTNDRIIVSDWVFVRGVVDPEPIHSTYCVEEAASCTAHFTGTPLTGCTPLSAQFTDASTTESESIVNWSWNFGDGNTSFNQNPSHTYNYTGTYDVNLTITNSADETSYLNRTSYITGTYTSNFLGTPTNGFLPLSVSFTDATCSPATSWYWDFGNGDINTTQDPIYIYDDVIGNTATSFNVSLNTTNGFNYDWENKTAYITLYPIITNFVGVPTSGATPLTVSFTSSTTNGTDTTWDWDFGDGSPHSALENPSHTYTTAGTYSVSLNASNAYTWDIENKVGYITVGVPTPTPTPTQTPSNATGGTRGYSAEETAIPFWLWAVIIILGSSLLVAGLFGRHLIFGIMSTMCFAAAAFASPMVSFFYQEVVLSNESEVAYSVFPMKWLVTQPWVAWLLWGMALLALLVVVYGVIVGMAEIKKPGDEFLEDDWLDKRDF